ncbi:hypothetical protein CH300_00205 [Rhodococcus sp. 15-1154-1]|nr:hypothetical protein [Rhodococcus sp. 15-1154-1]OZF09838.1 hypothetical protein CH300_00205 [Rhodococcus sp. 15-1154-1]
MYTFLTAEGIGDTQNTMMSQVAKHLDPDLYVTKRLPWRSQYGPVPRLDGLSFDRNIGDGIQMAAEMIRRDSNVVMLGGFSGGAALMRLLARQIRWGDLGQDLQIAGLATIADPYRPPGVGAKPSDGWGIAGRVYIDNFPQWTAADPRDVICCCPSDSPLRTLADQSSSLSFVDPAAWAQNLGWKLTTRQFQAVRLNWHDPRSVFAQYARARSDLDGYLKRGDHTQYAIRVKPGTNLTYTAWLADQLNRFAAKR